MLPEKQKLYTLLMYDSPQQIIHVIYISMCKKCGYCQFKSNSFTIKTCEYVKIAILGWKVSLALNIHLILQTFKSDFYKSLI